MKFLPRYLEDEGAKCSHSISLLENQNFLSPEEATQVTEYMESAVMIDSWYSLILDPVTSEQVIPCETWSDGTYIWDAAHHNHVKHYRVRLPEKFISHVQSCIKNKFIPDPSNKDALYKEYKGMLKKLREGDETLFEKWD